MSYNNNKNGDEEKVFSVIMTEEEIALFSEFLEQKEYARGNVSGMNPNMVRRRVVHGKTVTRTAPGKGRSTKTVRDNSAKKLATKSGASLDTAKGEIRLKSRGMNWFTIYDEDTGISGAKRTGHFPLITKASHEGAEGKKITRPKSPSDYRNKSEMKKHINSAINQKTGILKDLHNSREGDLRWASESWPNMILMTHSGKDLKIPTRDHRGNISAYNTYNNSSGLKEYYTRRRAQKNK